MNGYIERTVKNKTEAQIMANFLWNEGCRHGDDIRQIIVDLRNLEKKWKVKPRKVREFVRV